MQESNSRESLWTSPSTSPATIITISKSGLWRFTGFISENSFAPTSFSKSLRDIFSTPDPSFLLLTAKLPEGRFSLHQVETSSTIVATSGRYEYPPK